MATPALPVVPKNGTDVAKVKPARKGAPRSPGTSTFSEELGTAIHPPVPVALPSPATPSLAAAFLGNGVSRDGGAGVPWLPEAAPDAGLKCTAAPNHSPSSGPATTLLPALSFGGGKPVLAVPARAGKGAIKGAVRTAESAAATAKPPVDPSQVIETAAGRVPQDAARLAAATKGKRPENAVKAAPQDVSQRIASVAEPLDPAVRPMATERQARSVPHGATRLPVATTSARPSLAAEAAPPEIAARPAGAAKPLDKVVRPMATEQQARPVPHDAARLAAERQAVPVPQGETRLPVATTSARPVRAAEAAPPDIAARPGGVAESFEAAVRPMATEQQARPVPHDAPRLAAERQAVPVPQGETRLPVATMSARPGNAVAAAPQNIPASLVGLAEPLGMAVDPLVVEQPAKNESPARGRAARQNAARGDAASSASVREAAPAPAVPASALEGARILVNAANPAAPVSQESPARQAGEGSPAPAPQPKNAGASRAATPQGDGAGSSPAGPQASPADGSPRSAEIVKDSHAAASTPFPSATHAALQSAVTRLAETAPAPLMPAAVPVHHAALAESILARARALPETGAVEVRFALEPEGLGTVRVRIESRGEHVRIEIQATSRAAIETLSPGISRLAAHLQEAGYRDAEIHLDLGTSGGADHTGNRGERPDRGTAIGTPEPGDNVAAERGASSAPAARPRYLFDRTF